MLAYTKVFSCLLRKKREQIYFLLCTLNDNVVKHNNFWYVEKKSNKDNWDLYCIKNDKRSSGSIFWFWFRLDIINLFKCIFIYFCFKTICLCKLYFFFNNCRFIYPLPQILYQWFRLKPLYQLNNDPYLTQVTLVNYNNLATLLYTLRVLLYYY